MTTYVIGILPKGILPSWLQNFLHVKAYLVEFTLETPLAQILPEAVETVWGEFGTTPSAPIVMGLSELQIRGSTHAVEISFDEFRLIYSRTDLEAGKLKCEGYYQEVRPLRVKTGEFIKD